MVALRSHEADKVLRGDLAGFSTFLVFGPDAGLVSERARAVARALVDDPADPFQTVRLSGDDVAGDPGRLADETNSVPMFGGRRVVRVDATQRNLLPAVEHHITAGGGCPVVLEAGNLKKDSALRRLVERTRSALALECSPDTEGDLGRLIAEEAAAAGLAVDPDAQAALLGLLGADRMASRAELAKLLLYAHGQARLTLDDVEAIVTDASANALDALIDATFLGDREVMEQAGRRVLLEGTDGGTVLMAALRHATFLHRAKLEGSGEVRLPFGASPRRRQAIERQLRLAPSEVLHRAVIRLGEAVGHARREPALARAFALRTLWGIAGGVQPRRR